jgi:signal transduction histidine kinase
VRVRLTLWYGAVLIATLLAFGLVLHVTLQSLITRPVAGFLTATAARTAGRWQQSPAVCPSPEERPAAPAGAEPRLPPPPRRPLYVACVDPQGRVLGATTLAFGPGPSPPEAFLNPSLVKGALRDGRATDIVDGGDEAGPIYRVAVRVPSDAATAPLGVVLAGGSIAFEMDTLQLLSQLLLAIGAVAVLVATLGGLFLASRALAPARQALSRQQTFIADASHELRTPLTLIRANAEVLLRRRDRLSSDDAALIDDIVEETEHMDRLTTNLLTLARLDAGRLEFDRRPVDLADVAARVAQRLAPVARAKQITVREEHGGDTQVVGDRQALEQAVMILVDNAVKYTPAGGGVTLRTAAGDGEVTLTVEDSGVGIPEEHLRRLGERFFRADPARAHDGGAGLGLSIAYGIAAAHGGTIQITSTPKQGTRATVRLAHHRPSR